MICCCAKSKLRIVAVLVAAALPAAAQQWLDSVAERARSQFEVPGIAVAIVKDGAVVTAKGYGVRKLGGNAPVTEHSLFRIASNTKAFTAAALAMLVDEGKLHWDDRVVDLLPGFQMYDAYATHEITVRDLLTHRSGLGLGAGDLMFWPATDFTRDQIIHNIRYLKPASSFRSKYAYDNLLYLVAGQIIPTLTGKRWDDFVRERIFEPVGMTSTNSSTAMLMKAEDVAAPHARADGKLVALEQTDHDNNAPAGAINSCVADLAKWVIVQLNRGALPGGKRLFGEERSREMWSAQTVLPIGNLPKGAPEVLAQVRPQFNAYGLGWVLQDYRGKKTVSHTGGLAGYVSRVTMIPEIGLGVIVLTNQEETGAFQAVTLTVLDHYLGAGATDWVTAYRELSRIETAEGEEAVRKSASNRNANSRPSLPLASYAGRYRDAWYGDVAIENRDGRLSISFTHTKQLTGSLEHWQYDTFVARWRDRTLGADAYLTFVLGPDGSIQHVKVAPVSPLTDFSFDFADLDLRPVR